MFRPLPRALALCAVILSGTVALQAQVLRPRPHTSRLRGHRPDTITYEQALARARRLEAQMTQQEKLDFIGGTGSWDIKPVPRLGIPHIYGADAQLGNRFATPEGVGYPSGQALAATWNRDIASEYGAALANDLKLAGYQFLNGPGMNLNRTPYGGRNSEYLSGEDPYIGSVLGTESIRALQMNGIMAVVKHPLLDDQETNRLNMNVNADERTIREIYMPPFEAAAKTANAASYMCTFVSINNVQACQNNYILNDVFKGQWGFKGFIMSDYNAILDGVAAALGGADLDMPSGYMMNSNVLTPAIQSGKLPIATIDDKIVRILTQEILFGFLDGSSDPSTSTETQPATSVKAANDMEREGVVLLTNKNKLLPLSNSVRSIAVIGARADGPPPTVYGSAHMDYYNYVSELQGLQAAAPSGTKVQMIREMSLEPAYTQSVNGFQATYYSGNNFSGSTVQRQERVVNNNWATDPLPFSGTSVQNPLISAVYTAAIRPTISGDHVFKVRADGAIKIFVDGSQIAYDNGNALTPTIPPTIPVSAKLNLQAGRTYQVRIEYAQQYNFISALGGFQGVQFSWASLQAPSNLAQYDAVIVAAGWGEEYDGEGFDHPFNMPEYQAQMLASVAAANPHTIALIHGGGSTDLAGFSDSVGALMYVWYPGQTAGTAISDVLFGKVSPSGKLPITLDRAETDSPTYASYPNVQNSPAITSMTYSEGLYVGYRGYEKSNKRPLFPFGFGLSYTDFSYSDMFLYRDPKAGTVNVAFRLTNTGQVAGAEVAQVYVGEENPSVDRPVKELKGFAKVSLQPGQTKWVIIPLNARAFAYYDVKSTSWKVDAAKFTVSVGKSSADLQLQQTVQNPRPYQLSVTTSEPAVLAAPTTFDSFDKKGLIDKIF